jgi:hypothetical protein
VVNGEISLRRLKLSIYEVVTPREDIPSDNWLMVKSKLEGVYMGKALAYIKAICLSLPRENNVMVFGQVRQCHGTFGLEE